MSLWIPELRGNDARPRALKKANGKTVGGPPINLLCYDRYQI